MFSIACCSHVWQFHVEGFGRGTLVVWKMWLSCSNLDTYYVFLWHYAPFCNLASLLVTSSTAISFVAIVSLHRRLHIPCRDRVTIVGTGCSRALPFQSADEIFGLIEGVPGNPNSEVQPRTSLSGQWI
jgi:hypothetical protein